MHSESKSFFHPVVNAIGDVIGVGRTFKDALAVVEDLELEGLHEGPFGIDEVAIADAADRNSDYGWVWAQLIEDGRGRSIL